jgi:hypothetical protein
MDNMQRSDAASPQKSNLDRFDIPIGILALTLYVIERWIAFAWLQSRSGSGTGWEAQGLEFFFGRPPYSILDILLGFDVPESWLGLLHPKNIAQAVLQALHFLINWFLAGLPFRFLLFLEKRRAEQE